MSKGLAPVEFADKSTQTEAKCEFSEVHATVPKSGRKWKDDMYVRHMLNQRFEKN